MSHCSSSSSGTLIRPSQWTIPETAWGSLAYIKAGEPIAFSGQTIQISWRNRPMERPSLCRARTSSYNSRAVSKPCNLHALHLFLEVLAPLKARHLLDFSAFTYLIFRLVREWRDVQSHFRGRSSAIRMPLSAGASPRQCQ